MHSLYFDSRPARSRKLSMYRASGCRRDFKQLAGIFAMRSQPCSCVFLVTGFIELYRFLEYGKYNRLRASLGPHRSLSLA